MKKATQPNGNQLDPRKLLEGHAKLARQVGDAVLIELRPAAHDWLPAPSCSPRGRFKSMARTQNNDRSTHSENGFWSTSSAIKVTRPKPCAPRTTSGMFDIMLKTVPPRSSSSSSLVTITGGRAGRSDRLVRAGEGIECLERSHFLLPAGQSRQDRPEDAVAHRLPVGTDRDDEMAAPRDPIDQRLTAQARRAPSASRGRRCR